MLSRTSLELRKGGLSSRRFRYERGEGDRRDRPYRGGGGRVDRSYPEWLLPYDEDMVDDGGGGGGGGGSGPEAMDIEFPVLIYPITQHPRGKKENGQIEKSRTFFNKPDRVRHAGRASLDLQEKTPRQKKRAITQI